MRGETPYILVTNQKILTGDIERGLNRFNLTFSGEILTDGPLPIEAMNLRFARDLREAGPWGAGFPEPLFCGDFSIIEQRTVGENHLKLRVQAVAGGGVVDAIAFNQAGPVYRGSVQLAYRLDVNEYRGFESPQFIVDQIVDL